MMVTTCEAAGPRHQEWLAQANKWRVRAQAIVINAGRSRSHSGRRDLSPAKLARLLVHLSDSSIVTTWKSKMTPAAPELGRGGRGVGRG